MRVRVLYHDHCFDGAASAAFFSRFAGEKFYPGAEFVYTGLAHKASQLFEPEMFDGDVNAIVDFKYSTDPRLTWWFDHHQSAFLTPADAQHFREDRSGRKFYDPAYKSCTKLLADVTSSKYGFDVKPLAELILRGGIPLVRQTIDKQNALAKAAGDPALKDLPIYSLAERLLPRLRTADCPHLVDPE